MMKYVRTQDDGDVDTEEAAEDDDFVLEDVLESVSDDLDLLEEVSEEAPNYEAESEISKLAPFSMHLKPYLTLFDCLAADFIGLGEASASAASVEDEVS